MDKSADRRERRPWPAERWQDLDGICGGCDDQRGCAGMFADWAMPAWWRNRIGAEIGAHALQRRAEILRPASAQTGNKTPRRGPDIAGNRGRTTSSGIQSQALATVAISKTK